MIIKEEIKCVVDFMTLWAGVLVLGHGYIGQIVKMHYFFKHLHLYSGIFFRQPLCIVMVTIEGSTKI